MSKMIKLNNRLKGTQLRVLFTKPNTKVCLLRGRGRNENEANRMDVFVNTEY